MLERLKKLNAIIMCIIILATSVNLNVLIENIDLSDISIFSSEVNSDIYENKTLMVTAKTNDFGKFGAEDVTVENGMYILKYKTEKETKNAYKKIKEAREVLAVEVNVSMEIQEEAEEIATKAAKLAIKEETANEKEETELAKYLKNNTKEEKEIKVAILDTGIDLENPLFEGRIINLNKNLSTTGDNTSIKDDNGHGTDMATIIANNSNKNVKLIPIKIANSEGKATILDAYNGIKLAMENGANIISISMNTFKTAKSEILENIIKEASKKGIKVIVSAGNNSMNVKNVVPANIDEAIVVSAINEDNTFANYSNYGDTVDYCTYGTYEGKQGTSYAVANVTGIIAQVLSKGDTIEKIDEYVVDKGTEGKDKYFGNGFVGLELTKRDTNLNEIPEDNFESTIFDVDWKMLSDEELNKYLEKTSDTYLAVWLQNLSEEDLELILSKNTTLVWDHIKYDEEDNEIYNGEYYKYLLNLDTSNLDLSVFANTIGKFYVVIRGDGNPTIATITLSTFKDDGANLRNTGFRGRKPILYFSKRYIV